MTKQRLKNIHVYPIDNLKKYINKLVNANNAKIGSIEKITGKNIPGYIYKEIKSHKRGLLLRTLCQIIKPYLPL